MLPLLKAAEPQDICLSFLPGSFDELLSKEWLLTNKVGSYSSSSLVSCNTRKYHGLLVASVNTPADRIMALSCCLENISTSQKSFDLSSFEFDNTFHPQAALPVGFRKDGAVHIDYKIGFADLTKTVFLHPSKNVVALIYDFSHVDCPFDFMLRPFVGLRNYHNLIKNLPSFDSYEYENCLIIRNFDRKNFKLILKSQQMQFAAEPQWWYNIVYRVERERGEECKEDLWTPGIFRAEVNHPCRLIFCAQLERDAYLNSADSFRLICETEIEAAYEQSLSAREKITTRARQILPDKMFCRLAAAADEFIVKKNVSGKENWTILAGYPWFSDWGRDTLISIPGLLLAVGRYETAKSVLLTFANAADDGMIPNYFDEKSGEAVFNSIDASLWFIHAAFEYLKASGDTNTFNQSLLPTIRWIVDSYSEGSRFGIHADIDGLITGGDCHTQLTWMDASFGGVPFTPRFGKVVEVNALWYSALCNLSRFFGPRNGQAAIFYQSLADKVANNFRHIFWNDLTGYLNDCVLPDGQIDASLRPNQIFAVSLPFSPLKEFQSRAIVDIVMEKLLTPVGVRTLDISDKRYRPACTGTWLQRDEAYHQGTIWGYLIGPFIEAYLKVNGFSKDSKEYAARFIEPLIEHFNFDACIGQVSEIFDGSPPHKPRGCFAQAWSTAELLRAYLLINT